MNNPSDDATLPDGSNSTRSDSTRGVSEGSSPPDPASTANFLSPDEQPGALIGRYKLLQKIGEGGFGVVYVAQQDQPVKRRVALKIIKLGMDTHQVVARFEAERQALALMDHPNIAKVLDAGSTDTGRPYFVMELVRGIKITDYCDRNKLATPRRLELFILVCHAIQHAHQKGIIHRDIKPSNILVTLHDGVPVPKVIDFGIAKATQGDLTDKTIYTQMQQFIGTPAYMSPEQAEMSGLDIDTRSDIYSLGVLLYELLTGRTPFDGEELVSQGLDAMRKAIREKEPTKPSSRLATLQRDDLSATASHHAADPPRLVRFLKGDLDWIAMKCLEKDRTRRYDSATGLAADLKRHLNNEPVTARSPSRMYRLQKSIRRNKLAYAAGTAIVLALVLGIAATAWQAIRATRAQHEAVAAQAQESLQRQAAQENAQKARTAQAAESNLRQLAQESELLARQRSYGSDMSLAAQALDKNNLGQTLQFLNRQIPAPGQQDLRGWEWRYLWQQSRSDALFTLCRLPSQILALSVSPDGNLLAIGVRHTGGVTVWDIHTRQQLYQLAPDHQQVCAAFSPADSLLAFAGDSAGPDGAPLRTLHIWNTATKKMIADRPLEATCLGLAFSQDGRTLLTSSTAQLARWRIPDLTQINTISNSGSPAVAQSTFATPDLTLAAYSPGQSIIGVMDLKTGLPRWIARAGNQPYFTALALSPDGNFLASASGYAESNIRLWDVSTHNELDPLQGHSSWVGGLVFWPDGKKLASSSADQTIRIWDMDTRKSIDELIGHQSEVWRLALVPGGKTLISGAKDGTVCFWDTSITHPRPRSITIPGRIASWRFSPDSQSLLTLNYQGQVSRWTGPDFQDQQPIATIPADGSALVAGTADAVFSASCRLLAIRRAGGIQVWDLPRKVLVRTIDGGFSYPQFLPSEEKLLAFQGNHAVQWNLATGQAELSWLADDFTGRKSVAISPDGRRAFNAGFSAGALAFDLAAGTTTKLPIDSLETLHLAVSPDGKQLALATAMGYARVWDTATWKLLATLTDFPHSVTSVAFSHDGQRLLVGGGSSGLLKMWDTQSWQNVLSLQGQDINTPIAFSPDGNLIGASSVNGTLQLWRAPSFDQIAQARDNSHE